jgi:hypothetical protein
MGLSIRAYARRRGVSHVAVLRAIKQGRVPVELDGTIDPVKADASWERSTDPERAKSKPKASAEKLRPVGEAALGSVRETLKEQGLPAGGNVTFVQARTAHEIAKAHLARLRLQRMKAELVDRARATALVFRLGREERDSWLNWPARIAALIAADLGVEAVCLEGDTDTLACIAGAVAEAVHGLPDDVAKRARAHLTDDLRAVVARFERSVARLRDAERHGCWSPESV